MDFKPRLVAFDLDGTLAESKQPLTLEMGSLLADLMSKTKVAVLSGASFAQMETQFLPALPEDAHFENLFLFPMNAARCYVYRKGKWWVQYDRAFNPIEREKVMQALKEAMTETGFAEDDPSRPKEWGERIEDRGAQITFSALGQKAPVEEKRAWDPTREKRKPLYDALKRRLPEFSIGVNAATSIDITHQGVNKAYGIRQLVELADVTVAEMLYIGDALEEGGNDSVVKETGIKTEEVLGPEDTERLIKDIISKLAELPTTAS